MTPSELHDYLLSLKNKNALDPNIAEYKKTIRKELYAFRSAQPMSNRCYRDTCGPEGHPLHLQNVRPFPDQEAIQKIHHTHPTQDVVFYSFMEAPGKPKIGEHEYKRLALSWKSLRKHNKDIEVRFCYNGDNEMWNALCGQYDIKMFPFHESFTGNEPNAWCIHRWYNLANFSKEHLNVLYLDADTYIGGDIQLVFDLYRRDPVYGREELGFRHDPNLGVCGEDPRFYLDLIDASIRAQGGKTEVQKYCLGVILLNHSVHKLFTPEILKGYTDLLERIHKFEVFYSIPNYRIMDEFAFWVLLSRWSLRTSLFGDQDVSQTFLERKHETHFNPLILHYTKKDEEKFDDWAPEFFCLSRTEEEREESELAAGGIYNVMPLMREELAMSMW